MSTDAWPGSLRCDAHPCEGPGSSPKDLLPDDRTWGSRPLDDAGFT